MESKMVEPRKAVFENLSTIFEGVREDAKKRNDTPEFPFGLKELDALTHGIKRGKLTMIAARTSEGKTALGMQLATSLADNGKTVAFISLEDDRKQIAEKIYCNIMRENNFDLQRGRFDEHKVQTANKLFEEMKILVLDDFGYNFEEIKFVVEELDPKPDIVFLDYVQMVERGEYKNRYDAISEFARKCKIFAEKADIGFVLMSQINRAGAKEERPALHHMSGCDTLEQVADLVLIMYYPYVYGDSTFNYDKNKGTGFELAPTNWMEVEIAKQKTGIRNVIVPLCYTGKHYLFEDWDGEVGVSK